MPVPKTSMNENSLPTRWEDEVRGSRKIGAMQAKTIAERVSDAPHHPFGRRVLRADARHQRRPALRGQAIGHAAAMWLGNFMADRMFVRTVFGDDRANAIPDHPEAVPHSRVKNKLVGKTLNTCGFPHRDHPSFRGMNWADRLVSAPVHAGAGQERRTETIPSEPRMLPDDVPSSRRDARKTAGNFFRMRGGSVPGKCSGR